MFRHGFTAAAVLVVAALALVTLVPALAQSSASGDAREINDFKLTDAGFTRYVQASRSLQALRTKAAPGSSANGITIDQAVARVNASPGAAAAVKAAGMTPREYVVFGMSTFQAALAAWALSQPGGKLPPGVSMDNVNFYRKHEAELAKIGAGKKSDDRDDGDDR